MAGIDQETEFGHDGVPDYYISDAEWQKMLAQFDTEPMPLIRMRPSVNVEKIAWRAASTFIAAAQGVAATVYAVWAFFFGYARGRGKR